MARKTEQSKVLFPALTSPFDDFVDVINIIKCRSAMSVNPWHVVQFKEFHFKSFLSMTVVVETGIDCILLKLLDMFINIPP
jgi:hypothetical protein